MNNTQKSTRTRSVSNEQRQTLADWVRRERVPAVEASSQRRLLETRYPAGFLSREEMETLLAELFQGNT